MGHPFRKIRGKEAAPLCLKALPDTVSPQLNFEVIAVLVREPAVTSFYLPQ